MKGSGGVRFCAVLSVNCVIGLGMGSQARLEFPPKYKNVFLRKKDTKNINKCLTQSLSALDCQVQLDVNSSNFLMYIYILLNINLH